MMTIFNQVLHPYVFSKQEQEGQGARVDNHAPKRLYGDTERPDHRWLFRRIIQRDTPLQKRALKVVS